MADNKDASDVSKVEFLLKSTPLPRKLEKPLRRHVRWAKLLRVADGVSRCGSIDAAAKEIGLAGACIRQEMACNPRAREVIQQAMLDATGLLERSVYRRATRGATTKDGKVLPPSDKLATFWLQAHKPDLYGQRKTVEVSGAARVTHTIELTDEQLLRIAAQGQAKIVNSAEPLEQIDSDNKKL